MLVQRNTKFAFGELEADTVDTVLVDGGGRRIGRQDRRQEVAGNGHEDVTGLEVDLLPCGKLGIDLIVVDVGVERSNLGDIRVGGSIVFVLDDVADGFSGIGRFTFEGDGDSGTRQHDVRNEDDLAHGGAKPLIVAFQGADGPVDVEGFGVFTCGGNP